MSDTTCEENVSGHESLSEIAVAENSNVPDKKETAVENVQADVVERYLNVKLDNKSIVSEIIFNIADMSKK